MSLRQAKKNQARNSMVKAASRLINKLGFEQATMRDIAKAANVSYQTLYNYFPTKALIVQAFLVEDLSNIDREIHELVAAYDHDCLERVNQIHKLRIDVVVHRDRELWREVLLDYMKKESGASALYQLSESNTHEAFRGLFVQAQQVGELDALADADILSSILFGISEFSFMQYVMQPTVSKVAIMQSLFEQTETVVRPYLKGDLQHSLR